jgi:hypothetical protein
MIFMFPYEDRGTKREQENHDELKSEAQVKAAVRKRDGYKCRDCDPPESRDLAPPPPDPPGTAAAPVLE